MRSVWLLVALVSSAPAEPLVVQALLEASVSTSVFAYRSGVIRQVRVGTGDRVALGDTLALLNDEELKLKEQAARLSLEKVQSRLARSRKLHFDGGISTQDLETLDFEVQTVAIRWRRAQIELEKTVITAPMAGILAETRAQVGERITLSKALFRIIQPGDLKAELFVPADQVAVVQSRKVAAVGTYGKRVTGRISLISPLIDKTSGTCRIVAEFPGAGQVFRPGMIVSVELNGE